MAEDPTRAEDREKLEALGWSEGPPVVGPGPHTYGSVSDKIADLVLTRKTPVAWLIWFGLGFSCLGILGVAIVWLLVVGVGIWGINIPVAWGFAITNFVWWIGIGHAGTLISAILLLLRQEWRTSINRFAEAMTLFAVMCAGLFPLLHLGRPWFFYWLLPYPNTMGLWPQFRSPLVWDVFAVFTYFTVSLIFWYLGLVPDLATIRDRSRNRLLRMIYGMFALGWRGSAKHWARYDMAYLLLGGLATPLVVSVHTVVSFDFTIALVPGWHSTIFPPYFVAGAIFSGFAMVLTLAILIRWIYPVQEFVTMRHLDNCAKLLLVTGLIVDLSYVSEQFFAWYSDNKYEMFEPINRALGPYWPFFWTLVFCNVVAPQIVWFRKARRNVVVLFILSIVVNVGMWVERYVIVIVSLHRDYMPSAWGMYSGTIWDYLTLLGSFGLFATCFTLFIRALPMISISEMRGLIPQGKPVHHDEARGI